MEQEIINTFAKVRADLNVHNMILTQLLGSYIQSMANPTAALGQMHEVLAARLDQLPITQGPAADKQVALVRNRLDDFFAVIGKSLKDK